MAIMTFTLSVEVDDHVTPDDPEAKATLSDLEEVLAKQNYDLDDSKIEVEGPLPGGY